MKTLKNILITAAAMIVTAGPAFAEYNVTGGEIRQGATPETLIYQGRLEKNGSPVSDSDITSTSFIFSIHNNDGTGTKVSDTSDCLCNNYNQATQTPGTCTDEQITKLDNAYTESNKNEPKCLWQSISISTRVSSGIFSVTVPTPWKIFSYPGDKYIEVKIGGSSIMRPREKIGAVPYAIVAKKLEDNASIKVASMSLVQNGNIYLNDGCIYFNNNGSVSTLCSSTTASAINSVQGDNVSLRAGTHIYMQVDNSERIRITTEGVIVGDIQSALDNPVSLLTVKGNMRIDGTLSGKDGNAVRLGSPLFLDEESNGINNGSIKITNNNLMLKAPGSENSQIVLSPEGFVGVGTSSPGYPLEVNGKLRVSSGTSNGITTGRIFLGTDDQDNNVINVTGSHLYLQKDSNKRVAIGKNNPEAKLDVAGGVKADSMTVTGVTHLYGDVQITGSRFVANNNANTIVYLPDTVIEGNLTVKGNIGLATGNPAYLDKSNVFLTSNTFNGSVFISSNVYAYQRVVAGGTTPLFGDTDRYLQVGGGDSAAVVHIVGGSGADSSVRFHHAGTETASITTAGNETLNFMVGGNAEQNIVSSLSNNAYTVKKDLIVGDSASPALLVRGSSVAVNSAQTDDNSILYVNGQLYAESIRFPDNSRITSVGSIGSPTGLRAEGDIRINSNMEIDFSNGAANKVLVIKDSKVGVGTGNNPIKATLHVNGNMLIGSSNENIAGDGVLATAGSVYASDSIKAGNSVYVNNNKIIDESGNITNATWKGETIDVAHGGTGKSALGTGIVKGEGSSVTVGKVSLNSEVQNVLSIANGGTGHASFTGMEGPLRYDGGTSFSTGTIRLNSEVSGILPVANGGTRQDLSGKSGIIRNYGTIIGTGTVNLSNNAEVSDVLMADHGGTGRNSYEQYGIFYADGTNKLKQISLPKGKVLVGNDSGAPVAGSITGTNIDVNTNTSGSIRLSIPQPISSTNTPVFAGITLAGLAGNAGQILQVDGSGNVFSNEHIDLSNVAGILPVSLGGTGSGTDRLGVSGPVRSYETFLGTGTISLSSGDNEITGVLSVANGGTGISSYSTGDILVADGSTSFTKVRLNDGQILIGRTNSTPVAAQITGTANQITVTPGSGSITLSLPQDINTTSIPTFANVKLTNLNGFVRAHGNSNLTAESVIALDSASGMVSGVLPAENGGTGQNLGGKTGILRKYSTVIGTGTVNLASSDDIGSSVLRIANGGTGRNSLDTGVLRYTSGDSITSGPVNLGSEVSGVLAIANGGTGSTSINTGVVHSNGSQLTGGKVNLTSEVENVLPVANGGTGKSSFTPNSVMVTTSTGAVSEIGLQQGEIIIGGASGVPSAGNILGDAVTGVVVSTETAGKIIIGLEQSIRPDASPVFTGLRLSGLGEGFVKTSASGVVSASPVLEMTDFTGILPVANGGTGRDEAYFASHPGPLYSYGNGAISTGTINLATEINGTLSMAHGGTGHSSFTAGTIIYAGASSLESLSVGSGKILIGQTDGAPAAANITPVANQTRVISDSGSITIGAAQDISEISTPTFAGLVITGFNGILKAGNTGNVSAEQVNLVSDTEGVLPVNKGGTGQNLQGIQGVLRQYSTLIGTGTVHLDDTSDVGSSILGLANGGTGASSFDTSAGTVIKVVSGTPQTLAAGKLNLSDNSEVSGILPVNRGGTGTDSPVANGIMMANGSGVFEFLNLSAKDIVIGNSSGEPVKGRIQGEADGISVSTSTDGSGNTIITLALPQELSTGSSPSFNSLTLSSLSNGFLTVDSGGTVGTHIVSTAEISGIMPVSKGGTGRTSLTTNALLIGNGTDAVTDLSLSSGQMLVGTETGPAGAALSGGNGINVSVNTGATPAISFSLAQDLRQTASPVFTGLTLSGLSAGVLSIGADGALVSGTLPVSAGGTGRTSYTGNSVLYASSSNAIEEISLGSGDIVMGNSSGQPVAGHIEGTTNRISVNTSNGVITISAPQNLNTGADVNFRSLHATGNITATEATITGTVQADTINLTGIVNNSTQLVLNSKACSDIFSMTATDGTMVYCNNCSDSNKVLIKVSGNWRNMSGSTVSCN